MICKQFRLSIPEKERLIRIKARTGIGNWNVICRWALCWSLNEPTVPGGAMPLSDSNVEMSWLTFAGDDLGWRRCRYGSVARSNHAHD